MCSHQMLRILIANYSGKHMRDENMWLLPKFERLYIGGWGIQIYRHHCYML